MKMETFFNKFDELADTPDAVPRMRRFILDLAVQGKLVAQDAKDEPADELLKRVQAEKARLVKSGEIKRQEQLPPVSEDAIPFSLPAGWAASQLGDVAVCLDYMREPINGTERDLRIAGKTQDELFPYYGATQQQGWIDDFIFDAELVLLGEDGVPFFDAFRSKAYLISGKTWVNNHAHVFRGILVSNPFLMHWLNVFDYTGRVAGSTRSKLNQAKAVDIPIALPPLAEQKRIVAKVDELMALCDRLEAQQQERETRHAALARASLARFADAPTPANLQFLFHPSYAIPPADLRKSILTLAVQGKLVPQDPNDEPAEELIVRIATMRNGKSAKQYEPVSDDEAPYEVPFSWAWVRLGNVSLTSDSGWSPQCLPEARSGTEWGVLKVSAVSWGVFKPDENKALPPGMTSRPDCEVKAGDFLLSRANTEELVARSVVVDQTPPRLMMSDKIVRFTFPDEIERAFINLANTSDPSRAYYARNASGTSSSMKNVGREVMCNLPIPLPPLAEQRRIVAKVEQLMALVDALETQLAASRTTAANLLSALVVELTNHHK